MTYFDQLCSAMKMVALDPRSVFLGQAVAWAGTGMTKSFDGIPAQKLVEMPVAEDMQMGMSTGLSLAGFLPVSVYPRWNFLLLATNQLVNHLDKLPLYSGFRPKVIVRVACGSSTPLDPGPQHLGDFSDAFRSMLKTVRVVQLIEKSDIMDGYRRAMEREGSTILVEYPDRYDER